MAKKIKPLTVTEIKNAKPRDKGYYLFDGDGLQIMIQPNGSKLWHFRYTNPVTKKRILASFGTFESVSLSSARERARVYRELVANGIDPKDHFFKENEKLRLNEKNTLLSVAQDWRKVKATKVAVKTLHDQWRRLEIYIFPVFGKMKITDISAPYIHEKLRPLAEDGRFELLKKIIRTLNEIMRYAVNAGLIQYNTIANVQDLFPSGQVKHRPSIRPEELPQFFQDLAKVTMQEQTRALMEWQLLTMVRPSEAAGTRWDEIDLDKKVWNIPARRMKGGKRPHSVMLSTQAINLLKRMQPVTGGGLFVFPKNGNIKENMSSESVNKVLRKAGYQGRLCSHGFRSIASTYLNELELNSDIIETLLSHVKGDRIKAAYDRSTYESQRREYLQKWGDFVEDCSIVKTSFSSI